ncbi:MAG: terpene cyclase/mutase family protein [Chloroflexi bacterium]|nr:terpene cyclase/mutase family protein [Chloroflexota bacterium]MBP8055314.1 terpene cyclase/mutase family protein [Chloroflexota bacterium]
MLIRISGLVFVLGLFLALGRAEAAAAATNQQQAVIAAANWLITTHQNSDGGYTSFSAGADIAPSDIGGTLDVILALSSAGYDVRPTYPGKNAGPVDYLTANADALLAFAQQDGGSAGKLVLGLLAAQQDPRAFGGQDYVSVLAGLLTTEGDYTSSSPYQQALAMLGLSAAAEPIPPSAPAWLINRQATEGDIAGSWDDGFGTNGNADATALSIMALLAAGNPTTDRAVVAARGFLAQTQTESGGWEYGSGFGANINSTALVVQALKALGEDYESPNSPWIPAAATPLAYLLQNQAENGAYQTDLGNGLVEDFYATVQALPALAGKSWPLASRVTAMQQAISCLQTLQDPATGGWENFAGFGVDAGGTARAIQALVAAGEDPTSGRWTVNGINAVQALENLTPAYLDEGRGGRVGTVMQGVAAAGGNVTDFAGQDLFVTLTSHYSPTGALDDTSFGVFGHSRALLGAVQAGYGMAELTPGLDFLLAAAADNEWGSPDVNGLALQVLGPLALSSPEMVAPLRHSQLGDGGWGFDVSNPNTTSEVVRGLVAVDVNPFNPVWSVVISGSLIGPVEVVLSTQGENGCWPNLYGPGDDPLTTTDAILLLAAHPSHWGETGFASTETSTETIPPVEPLATPEPTAYSAAAPSAPQPTTPPLEYIAPTTVVVLPTVAPTTGYPGIRDTPTPIGEVIASPTATNGGSIWVYAIVLVLVVAGLGVFFTLRRR